MNYAVMVHILPHFPPLQMIQVPQMSPKDGNSNSSGQVNVVPSPSSSSSSQPPSSVVVQQQQQQSGVAVDTTLLIGTADPSQMMTSSIQQQPQHLQMQQPQMQLQQQQQVLKPLQHHQQQLIEVQGNSLDDGTDSLDELTTASNSNAISALLDSNTNPSSSNDTNTNASLDSVIGDGSKNATTSTSTTTCTGTINTNSLLSNNTLSDNATSNVLSCSQDKSAPTSSNSAADKPNLLVAANIANTFINLSNINPGVRNDSESGQAQQQQHQNPVSHSNVNVVVSQPVTAHVMKTFTIGTNRGNIFVPNVIATNISPHFTVHHHQYGLRNGPAPNVTVNPNGNFNTNSSAVIRPGFTHIRPFLPQSSNINFNIIGNSSTIQSPILAASLQTINKIAAQQQQQAQHPGVQHPLVRTGVNKFINVGPDGSQKILLATPVQHLQAQQQVMLPIERQQAPGTPSPVYSPQRSQTPCVSRSLTPHLQANMANNDQQIRVLTPSEIMRTLPSLDSASFESHMLNDSFGKSHSQTHTIIANTQNLNNTNMSSVTHSNNNNNSMGSDSNNCNVNESSGSESFESLVNNSNLLQESSSNGGNTTGPDYSDTSGCLLAADAAASYNGEPGCPSNPMTTIDTPCSLGANTSATSTATIVTNTTSYSSSSATTSVTTTTSTTTTTTTTVVTTTSTTAPETVRTMKASKRNRFDLLLSVLLIFCNIYGFCLTVSLFVS